MSETFDFGDGNGPVPAHRHKHYSGDYPSLGGWVADTAYVPASASVHPESVVFGSARVLDNAVVYGYSRISGTAQVPAGFAVDSGILEKPEDLRVGVGWFAHRITTGVEVVFDSPHLMVAHVRSWDELPRKLHDLGAMSTPEYLAQALAAAQESTP